MRQQNLLGLTLFSAVQAVMKTTVKWQLGGGKEHWARSHEATSWAHVLELNP